MAKKRIIILGAGIAGLSAAWHLQKKGVDCLILEKEAEVGGLCRSKNLGGFIFDYSGHLLHFRHNYSFSLVKKMLGGNLVEHNRNAWIYSHNVYTRYPFQANLYGLPSSVVRECLFGACNADKKGLRVKKHANFLHWINDYFGEGIARHFMVPYNTKFWTVSPEKLSCEWLDGFIPVPSLKQIIEGTVAETKRKFGYNSRFWYPRRGGIGQLPLAFASSLKNVHKGCEVKVIDILKKEIQFASGGKERFDCLVSTIPLPELKFLLKGAPRDKIRIFDKLKWNSIFNLNLGIEKKRQCDRHWIYFPEKHLSFYRLGFFHNFSSRLAPEGSSSLYIELSYSNNKPIDRDGLVTGIKKDLFKTGIIKETDNIRAQDANDIKYGYPIYDSCYAQAREEISGYLSARDILLCGRYGSWRYFAMEDAILDGKRTADHILKNA